jgi:hypothetical protein
MIKSPLAGVCFDDNVTIEAPLARYVLEIYRAGKGGYDIAAGVATVGIDGLIPGVAFRLNLKVPSNSLIMLAARPAPDFIYFYLVVCASAGQSRAHRSRIQVDVVRPDHVPQVTSRRSMNMVDRSLSGLVTVPNKLKDSSLKTRLVSLPGMQFPP